MTKASQCIISTEVTIDKDHLFDAANIWQKSLNDNSELYVSEEQSSLLELTATDISNFPKEIDRPYTEVLTPELQRFMCSDFHREVLSFKESVIKQETLVPRKDYLQMRYIEVPLNVHEDYLAWRETTIFRYVKDLDNVDSFTAYHSAFSTLPGVMFICSFSCDPVDYQANFTTTEYQNIIKQAGDKYIANGESGLYTKIYKRVKPL